MEMGGDLRLGARWAAQRTRKDYFSVESGAII